MKSSPPLPPRRWSIATPLFFALARYTLEAAIEGAQRLGCDQALIPRFKKAIQNLPEYPRHGEQRLRIRAEAKGSP